ncbi:MAG: ribosomal protein L7/L12 [Pyrinomonadaceae bacterium]
MLLALENLEMLKLNIIGWRKGLLKISMTHVLREHLPLGMREAKDCVDNILDGQVVSFSLNDFAKAEALAKALEDVGAIVEIEAERAALHNSLSSEV